MRYGRSVLNFLSSTTYKNHSEQKSEENELDSTSRLDSICLIFGHNFAFTESFQSDTYQLKTVTSIKKRNFCEPIQSLKKQEKKLKRVNNSFLKLEERPK